MNKQNKIFIFVQNILFMAYIYDSDLEFLKECENDDLRTLVDYLTTLTKMEMFVGQRV